MVQAERGTYKRRYRRRSGHRDPRAQTVSTVLRRHLEEISTRKKASTIGVYTKYMHNRIDPYFEKVKCADLRPEVIQGFVDKQAESGLAPATVGSIFFFIKQGLGNFFPGNHKFELPEVKVKGLDILSVSEQKRLESAAEYSGNTDRLAIFICLYTGIKIGELCGLMWKDVDLDKRTLTIRQTVQRIKNPEKAGSSKTSVVLLPANPSSRRTVPLSGFLPDLLKTYKAQPESKYVIPARNGTVAEPRMLQHRFRKLLKTANIRSVPFQVLRDTFAARALEKGFDLLSLSEILGHCSVQNTLKKYSPLMEAGGFRYADMDALSDLNSFLGWRDVE